MIVITKTVFIILCKSNDFILFLMRKKGVNFEIIHKKRPHVN